MNEHRGIWRGKRVDNGKWVKGYLIKMWGKYHLQDQENENLVVEVYPETLGECVGFPARCGKLIFEGDFLQNIDNEKIGLVAWSDRGAGFVCRYKTDFYDTNGLIDLRAKRARIIGNIHDHP